VVEMKKVNVEDMKGTHPDGTEGVDFKPLLAKNVDPPNFYLRIFDVSPEGHTFDHSHPWEHEMYVVKGRGKIVFGSGDVSIKEGDAILIEPDEKHMVVNDSHSMLRLVCVVPKPESDR
jgi:quercetin dioxygenase-like cupin family protein